MRPATLRRATLAATVAVTVGSLAACSSSSGTETVASDCQPEHEFSTVTEGTLTVATYEFAPHTILDGDELSGVEGELLAELAARECLTLTVDTAGGAAAAVPSVETGRADLAAGDWWRTEARSQIVSLSDPIYLDQGAIVTTAGIQTIADLQGHKFGSVAGNLWNDQFAEVFGDDFTVYQDGEAAFTDLEAGRVDAIIDSVGATTARFESAPIEGAEIVPLEYDESIPASEHPGQVNWPTSQDNPDLTAAVNEDIAAMHEDGTIVKILEKYGIGPEAEDVGEPTML